jgi:hypothetical protein
MIEEQGARGMVAIFGSVSLLMLLIGAALALASSTYPTYVKVLEYVAGVLILGGLALLGVGLGFAFDPPAGAIGWP